MTREEAAREIEKTIKQLEVYLTPDGEWVVALTVAIDAICAQPAKLDRDQWEGCGPLSPCVKGKSRRGRDE